MLIIPILFCLGLNLLPEAASWFAGMATDAALLALTVFAFVILRSWSVARAACTSEVSQ
jgi:hypothetical protein